MTEQPWRDEDNLRRLYHGETMSMQEIADHLGCGDATIFRWMRKFDIPTRDRSEASRVEYAGFSTKEGYEQWQVKNGNSPIRFRVHRLLAIAEYGFDAIAGNVVHHINNIPWDNRPGNLEVMSESEHNQMHAKERWRTMGKEGFE